MVPGRGRNDLQFMYQHLFFEDAKYVAPYPGMVKDRPYQCLKKGVPYVSKVVDNVLSKSSPFDNMGKLHCFDLNLSGSQKCRVEDLLSTVIY